MPDLRELAAQGQEPTLQFDYLTRRRSFDALTELALEVYGHAPRASHTDPDLWRAFPRGYVGCWINDRLRGCIQLWPLDGRQAGDFLVGARSERDLSEDDFVTVCNSLHTVYYFSGLVMDPEWQGRGMAAHLLAESMARWYRDLPWRPPIAFAALATSEEGRGFAHEFGMQEIRTPADTADGYPLYARRFEQVSDLFAVAAAARAAADRKGRLLTADGAEADGL